MSDHDAPHLPAELALFPLRDALLLPRGRLPLNIFEPRYLEMVEHAFANDRMIGMIRPRHDEEDVRPPLYQTGCAGRIVAFSETGDGRFVLTLGGVTRFKLVRDTLTDSGFRLGAVDYSGFADDHFPPEGDSAAQRDQLVVTLQSYLTAMDMSADWDSVDGAPIEAIVNAISIGCPFDPDEKQALLEAPTVTARADALIAMMELGIATEINDGPDPSERLQ